MESVSYNDHRFEELGFIVSRVQYFYYKYLKGNFTHPEWFENILEPMLWNSHMDFAKRFFDEEELEPDPDKKAYTIEMTNKVIDKMSSITEDEFMSYVDDGNNENVYTGGVLASEDYHDVYNQRYIGTLLKVRDQLLAP